MCIGMGGIGLEPHKLFTQVTDRDFKDFLPILAAMCRAMQHCSAGERHVPPARTLL